MTAEKQMCVIREDGAGVAGVVEFFGGMGESIGNGLPLRGVEPQRGVIEKGFGVLGKVTEILAWGLDGLASVVYGTEVCELWGAEFDGAASSRVVGEPVPVAG
jgi:hypothetical protein